ncbi:uncharacterized protein ACO6RY_12813 [Pungitius sinensis]
MSSCIFVKEDKTFEHLISLPSIHRSARQQPPHLHPFHPSTFNETTS